MPKLVYTPEGAEPRVWEFAFGRILSPERIAIERATGLGWTEVCEGFFDQNTAVLDAFLHVLMKRDMPTLKQGQIEWCGDEVEVDLTDAEAADFVRANRDDPDEATQSAVAALLAVEGVAALVDAEVDDPKGTA